MIALAKIWDGLQLAGKSSPYVLIDCAGIDGGESRIPRGAFSELECLFTGDLAIELANVGPYLGRMKSYEADAKAVVEGMLNAHVALLVILQDAADAYAEITFSQLHRHFRKFNVVYDPAGKPLFFRYYDPRVLLDVLTVLNVAQLDDFFGPVETLVLVDRDGNAMRCIRQGGKLAVVT